MADPMRRLIHTRMLVSTHGAIVSVISAAAIVSHFIDLPLMASSAPMAMPTAMCFLLIGSAFMALGLETTLWNHHALSD